MMIPDTTRRLAVAWDELSKLMVGVSVTLRWLLSERDHQVFLLFHSFLPCPSLPSFFYVPNFATNMNKPHVHYVLELLKDSYQP